MLLIQKNMKKERIQILIIYIFTWILQKWLIDFFSSNFVDS